MTSYIYCKNKKFVIGVCQYCFVNRRCKLYRRKPTCLRCYRRRKVLHKAYLFRNGKGGYAT